jgi:hypothetical protein
LGTGILLGWNQNGTGKRELNASPCRLAGLMV